MKENSRSTSTQPDETIATIDLPLLTTDVLKNINSYLTENITSLITKTNRLMTIKEIVSDYSENHTEQK
jgi:hypothetical protein